MSEVKIVVRDAEEDRSGTVHGSVADWFVAALSADPVSISELDAAIDRFALKSPDRGHMAHFRQGLDLEPYDAGLVVIDLAARLVAIDSTYSSPGLKGTIQRHDIDSDSTVMLNYRLSDEWRFVHDPFSWEGTADVRRRQRADQPDVDPREIFYGEPMLRFIIEGCLKEFARRNEIAEQVRKEWVERERKRILEAEGRKEDAPDPQMMSMRELAGLDEDDPEHIDAHVYYKTIRDIHADWLMTACPELNDEIPRTVLLREHSRLSEDMSDRESQWTILNKCPPGISPESHAFRFGGFNTAEIVLYYDYVREVAWACWHELRAMPQNEWEALECGKSDRAAFVVDELFRLRDVGKKWLQAPWEDDPSRTPHSMINMERRRLPNSGVFHPIDPDCSFCEELSNLSGIGFWHLDGCNMDDLFAFAYHHETIESWEQEQAEWRELDAQIRQQGELAKQLGLPPEFSEPPAHFSDVWRLKVETSEGEIPIGYRLRKVGHEVVAAIVKLRAAAKHDSGFSIDSAIESLRIAWGLLNQSCAACGKQELSPAIDANVNQLLFAAEKLAADLERYVETETDDAAVRGEAPDSRWGKILNPLEELSRRLKVFSDPVQETPDGGWYADDVPF